MKTHNNRGIRHDYKDVTSFAGRAQRRHRWSWFALGLSLPAVTVALLLISERNESKPPALDEVALNFPASRPEPPARSGAESSPEMTPEQSLLANRPDADAGPGGEAPEALEGTRVSLAVGSGDSLERLFRRAGLDLPDLAEMVALPDAAEHLKLLRPGDEIEIVHRDGDVLSLSREIDDIHVLSIEKDGSGYAAERIARDVDVRAVAAHGAIETSLFEAGKDAGISDAVTMNMAGIFQWDIDFIQDVRVGDTFTVIYEELWRDGVKLRSGEIVAAEFVNQGRTYRAARYTDAEGRSDYYTPDGRSVRKAFIRAPVSFTRISSNFNPNRRHPVLNTLRAHRGVDYAAPTGTPVKAAGDGKVEFRGVKGGYGNAVILRHGGNITTLYGHLSRFAEPRRGERVEQGDIIGYVGQSGLATGPHLHYEYRLDGVHRNPRTVPLPPADPVPARYRGDFEATTAALWEQLDAHRETRVAKLASD